MKRLICVGVILILLLTSCQQLKQTTIQQASLSDFEQKLLESLSQKSFAFDLNLTDDDVENIEVNVTYYEHGELIETVLGFGVSTVNIDGDIRIVIALQETGVESEKWNASIITEGSTTSTQNEHSLKISEKSAVWGQISSPVELEPGEEIYIAHIIHSDDEVISSINPVTEEDLDRVTNYDHVYLISVMLK